MAIKYLGNRQVSQSISYSTPEKSQSQSRVSSTPQAHITKTPPSSEKRKAKSIPIPSTKGHIPTCDIRHTKRRETLPQIKQSRPLPLAALRSCHPCPQALPVPHSSSTRNKLTREGNRAEENKGERHDNKGKSTAPRKEGKQDKRGERREDGMQLR